MFAMALEVAENVSDLTVGKAFAQEFVNCDQVFA